MPLRFRRRVEIAPGLTLNLGKRGASMSVGTRGAHVTLGHHGARETVGVPGTGVSYTRYVPRRGKRSAKNSPGFLANLLAFALGLAFLAWLFGWL